MITAEALREIVGGDWVVTGKEQTQAYKVDATPPAMMPKAAENVIVVKPATAEEISSIMKLANKEKTPVYVRGGGTGMAGGAIPTTDGVVISMERFDKIEEIDTHSLMAVAQAGVTLGQLLEAAEAENMSFPPHPGDEGAQLGGLVVCNAGGARAVKFGVMRNYVKGLEVVLPTGEIVQMGGKLLKNNSGLPLLHLMVDSEGILGVVTKVILRLYPRFPGTATMVISFDDRSEAVNAVPAILQAGIIPLAIEFMDREIADLTANYLGMTWPAQKGKAYLIVILTGANEDEVYFQAEEVEKVCQKHKAVDTLMAERREEQATILKIRSEVQSAVSPNADSLDTAVPPGEVARFMNEVDKIADKYGVKIPVVGHVADGNFHHILKQEIADRGILTDIKDEIYDLAIRLGGTITAEHGIGKKGIRMLDRYTDERQKQLMREIKKAFDPNNILNPGTAIVP
ncbi:MAG: FAD-binding oxidoreductase [Dehalococcoidia bacterium]|jgi:glycolate oxidase|nr:FAD-binding oxidoreductase [Dehalococcoidia bacterium]